MHSAQSRKNKIIVLLGSATSGKSTVAFALARKMRLKQIIDTDIIRAVKITTEPDNQNIRTFSFKSWKLIGKKQTKKNIIAGYRKYTKQIEKEIRGIININNEWGRSIIIEGVHIYPEYFKDILSWDNVYPFVINPTRVQHLRNIKKRVGESYNHNSLIYLENFTSIREIQKHLCELAAKQGIPIIKADSLTQTVKEISKRVNTWKRKE